jgi:release factor glutamine methyltransferase
MLRQNRGMLPENWTILTLLKWTTAYFKSHHVEQPRATAEILLAHTLGVGRVDLYVQYERLLEEEELGRFKGYIRRRTQREPVAYIVGKKEFWSMDFEVAPGVLIPRPETETLVEAVLMAVPEEPTAASLRILDLGTGSGAVIVAVASERPGHEFYAVDRSQEVLAAAHNNARAHGLDKTITFLQGDWFDPVRELGSRFDVIVSNPPYISTPELEGLPPEISRHEPREALDGGPDGLDPIRLIVREASDYLAPGGWLLFEIGHDQWDRVEKLIFSAKAYRDIDVVKDYGGRDRVARARRIGDSR